MGLFVVEGAALACPMGAAPGTLHVTSQMKCMFGGKLAATINDAVTGTNITPFGMCSSLANPAVASATSAAAGVLTPQPCAFMPSGTWIPTQTKVIAGVAPCLTNDAKIMCSIGMQTITITNPGQTKCKC